MLGEMPSLNELLDSDHIVEAAGHQTVHCDRSENPSKAAVPQRFAKLRVEDVQILHVLNLHPKLLSEDVGLCNVDDAQTLVQGEEAGNAHTVHVSVVLRLWEALILQKARELGPGLGLGWRRPLRALDDH